jgi:hypothetical protein
MQIQYLSNDASSCDASSTTSSTAKFSFTVCNPTASFDTCSLLTKQDVKFQLSCHVDHESIV